jgi:hypothetical protein
MRRNLFVIIIALALGIILFPLGGLLFLSKHISPMPRKEYSDPPILREIQAEGYQTEGLPPALASPDHASPEKQEAATPEGLARSFRVPLSNAATEFSVAPRSPSSASRMIAVETEADGETEAALIAGDEKYRYLGTIRDADDQERLYLKDRETGAFISVNAIQASPDAAAMEFALDGARYSIRRN